MSDQKKAKSSGWSAKEKPASWQKPLEKPAEPKHTGWKDQKAGFKDKNTEWNKESKS